MTVAGFATQAHFPSIASPMRSRAAAGSAIRRVSARSERGQKLTSLAEMGELTRR
jgi:hypothetical protein